MILLLLCFLLSCQAQNTPAVEQQVNPPAVVDKALPYDLDHPDRIMLLQSPRLYEISGLSPAPDSGQLCAIADEGGEVFFLDAQTGDFIRSISFRLSGDFEGVEWNGKCIYAVKSDGDLFELDDHETETSKYVVFKTPLKKSQDVEGLCYDAKRNVLLLATKGNPDLPDSRGIYTFDLETKELNENPVIEIDPVALENSRKDPSDRKTEYDSYFSPSGIAVHPQSGHYYILSSAKRRLAVLDPESGETLKVKKLEKEIFPQPEGICFDNEGKLYIASEGKGGKGRIVVYSPQP